MWFTLAAGNYNWQQNPLCLFCCYYFAFAFAENPGLDTLLLKVIEKEISQGELLGNDNIILHIVPSEVCGPEVFLIIDKP